MRKKAFIPSLQRLSAWILFPHMSNRVFLLQVHIYVQMLPMSKKILKVNYFRFFHQNRVSYKEQL